MGGRIAILVVVEKTGELFFRSDSLPASPLKAS
jgi:hypothetical protein